MPSRKKTLSDLVYHFSGVVWSTKRGRLLLSVWAGFLGWTACGAPSPLKLWQKTVEKKRSKKVDGGFNVPTKKQRSHVIKPF